MMERSRVSKIETLNNDKIKGQNHEDLIFLISDIHSNIILSNQSNVRKVSKNYFELCFKVLAETVNVKKNEYF
jgi:hypothetical protein